MTATLADASASSSRQERVSWRSVGKVVWLEHRPTLVSVALLAAVILAGLLVEGLGFTMTRAQFIQSGGANTNALTFLNIIVLAFPVVIGIFVGAPLVARELETGAFRFTWTQGVGRDRFTWITVMFLSAGFAVLACVIGALFTWYAGNFEALGIESRWQGGFFAATPLMLPAWTLLGLALGTLAGTAVKRTVASMAVTTVAIAGLLTASFAYLTSRLLSVAAIATNRISPVGLGLGNLNMTPPSGWPGGGWLVRSWLTNTHGRLVTGPAAVRQLYRSIQRAKDAPGTGGHAHGQALTFWVSYQPSDRFWIFQLILAVILLGVAAVALIVAARRIRAVA